MRVLFLGAGRFMGRRAAEMMVAAGHDVTVLNRSSPLPGARHVAADRQDPAALARAFAGAGYDCVIDFIAYRRPDVAALAPLLEGKAGQYVLVSSFAVYGPPDAQPLRPIAEEEADLDPWTVLRLANVDGPGDPSNRRGFFVDRVADGGGLLVPSDAAQPFQPLWRDDAARASAAWPGSSTGSRCRCALFWTWVASSATSGSGPRRRRSGSRTPRCGGAAPALCRASGSTGRRSSRPSGGPGGRSGSARSGQLKGLLEVADPGEGLSRPGRIVNR